MDIEEIALKVGGFEEMITSMLESSPQTGKIKRAGDQLSCCCPFHEEKLPSFGVRADTGAFNCFACAAKGGGMLKFVKDFYHVEAAGAYKKIYAFYRIENDFVSNGDKVKEAEASKLEPSLAQEMNRSIKSMFCKDLREKLAEEWGLEDLLFLDKYMIGWSDKRTRLSIPVFDEEGILRNIRLYSFDKAERETKGKMISWKAGTGDNRLYPISSLKEDEIWICEGEKDTLVALNKGLNAITMTAGANSWSSLFNEKFKGKKVNIAFDLDKAGDEGSSRIAHDLFGIAREVRVIKLPMTGGKTDKDMADYFIKNGGTKADLEAIRDKTEVYVEISATEEDHQHVIKVINADKEHIDIVKWVDSNNHNTMIEATVTFVGSTKEAHCVPKEAILRCDMLKDNSARPCSTCLIGMANASKRGGTATRSYVKDDRELLKYLDMSEEEIEKDVRRSIPGASPKCRIKCTVSHHYHIYANFMVNQYSPVKKTSGDYDTSTEALAYSMGFPIKENNSYKVKGSLISLPQNSKAGYMLTEADPISDFIDTFALNNEDKENLKVFQAEEKNLASVKAKLSSIYSDFRDNVTGIIGREIVHMAADIAYHSCLYFEIPGDRVHRGQIDMCIMGDSRTGKNGVVDKLKEYFGIGAGLSGEAVSFAGLVGGCVQSFNRNVVRWGRMPINDRGLVIIDETSGMDAEVINKLSQIRSAGEATITKAGVSESHTNCRCRIIWIANPRDGRNLNENSYPITKLLELFGSPEDVSRLDYACLVEQDSDLTDQINSVENSNRIRVPNVYTSELCKKLVCWAWSRKKEHIAISDETRRLIYHYAGLFSKDFSSDLLLVEPANFRAKLAKVAISIAIRLYSTEDGENVIVRKEHVLMALQFFIELYSSKCSRYKDYCNSYQSSMKLYGEEKLKEVIDEIKLKFPNRWQAFVELMTKSNEHYYSAGDFKDCLGLPETLGKTADNLISTFVEVGALTSASGRYKRKSAFKQWFAKYLEKLNNRSVEDLYAEPK